MVMNIGWKDLPKSVETNIDIYTGFYESGDHTRLLWLNKVQECAAQFNASYDDGLICFIFESEQDYLLFLLRWA